MSTLIEEFLDEMSLYYYNIKYTCNDQHVNIFKTDKSGEVIEFKTINTPRFIEEVMYHLGIEKHKI